MGILVSFVLFVFLIINSFSIYTIIAYLFSKKKISALNKKLVYLFPSIVFFVFAIWGGYLFIDELLKDYGDPNIGLGIVIFWGSPFCIASFGLSIIAHYLISKKA